MACVPPDGFEGGLGGLPRYTDNINVYVGKDATLRGAETEGLVFVEGDLKIDCQPGVSTTSVTLGSARALSLAMVN